MSKSNITDLVDEMTENGFVFQSWFDDGYVMLAFGLVTLSIPETEFSDFAKYVEMSAMKKNAIEKMENASKKNRRVRRNDVDTDM
jgi:hypothetical protein